MSIPQTRRHVALHLCRELHLSREGSGMFVRGGQLICPDLVCRRQNWAFDNELYLLWHLAAVHRVQLKQCTSDGLVKQLCAT